MKIAQTFIPRPKEAREFLEKMRREAPLLSMFKIGIIEKDGHTAATVGSLDEDPEGRLHRQLQEVLTESLWRYFTVLYIDKKGGFNRST